MKIEQTKASSGFWLRLMGFVRAEREVILAFVGTRLLLWLVMCIGFLSIEHGPYQIFPGLEPWNLLYHWDAFWYARIVAHGYDYSPAAQSSAGFFPLLPMAIFLLRRMTGLGTALTGFLITNACLLASAVLLRRLVLLDLPRAAKAPLRAVWFLLLCPMTFFFSAVYTEAPFLMLSLASIFFARKGRWFLAGMSGALLAATRGTGILILVPLLWEAFAEQNPQDLKDGSANQTRWWLVLVPLGLAAYMAYLSVQFGDPLAFLHAQKAFHREFASPLEGAITALRYPGLYGPFFFASGCAGVVLLCLAFMRRLRLSYCLYALVMVVLCLSTSIWESVPRYLSQIFPFYIVLGTTRSLAIYSAALAISTVVMAICAITFASGYFMT